MANTSEMTLEAWAKVPGASLFDVECWTIARCWSPVAHRGAGFVLFTRPLPYRVFYFRKLEDIARYLRRPLCEMYGTVFYDTDWARREAGLAMEVS
jgi:hypothetical protein